MKINVRTLWRPVVMGAVLLAIGNCSAFGQSEGAGDGRNPSLRHGRTLHPVVMPDSAIPAGTYTVGSGQYFPTLDSVLHRLSGGGVLGPVTLLLTDTLYVPSPSDSGSFRLDGPISGAGPASRITIRPADNTTVTIRGDGEGVLTFQDASYVTLDGINEGSTQLRVHALYNTVGTQWNDAIDFVGNSDFNIIRNLTASTEDIARVSAAIAMFSDDFGGPDSCLISGSSALSGGLGIYVGSHGPTWPHRPSGNVIRNNQIGSSSDSLVSRGIQLAGADGTLIEGNRVEHLRLTMPDGGGVMRVHGINAYFAWNTVIRANIVHDICGTQANSTPIGILASGGTSERGRNTWIYNNMVYDIRNRVASVYYLAGIRAWGQDSLLVHFNSVFLEESGDIAPALGSACVWITSTTSPRSIMNNILVNTRNDDPAISNAVYVDAGTVESDHNDLYVSSADSGYVVSRGTTNYRTLADWQATGNDPQSVSVLPVFLPPHLHIDTSPVSAGVLDGIATPIPGVTVDADGDLRNPITPDIGADEFDPASLPVGTYTVGAGDAFPTLKQAFRRLSTAGILGPVTLLLTDTLYVPSPSDSGSFRLDGPISGAGPASRITIRPADNTTVTIRGNGEGVLMFQDVSYVTLDGVNEGTTQLRVHALYNTVGAAWNDAIDFVGNSDFNIIRNLSAWTDDITNRGSGAVVLWADDLGAPDSSLITGVSARSGMCAIYVSGYSPAWLHRPMGNIIRNNHVGSPTDSLVARGIIVEGADGTVIEGNHVEHMRLTLPDLGGVMRTTGVSTYYCRNTTIRNNVVHDICGTQANSTPIGILAAGGTSERGRNTWIYNNMVYDIKNRVASIYSLTGIRAWYQDSLRIHFNSVLLEESGDIAPALGSACVWITSTSFLRSIMNNILVNTRNDDPAIANALYVDLGSLQSDHNNLYVSAADSAYVVSRGTTNYRTLANWQVTGYDLQSVSILPVFLPPHLHIDTSAVSADSLNGRATPIAGIPFDADGDLREQVTPDIGADEFGGAFLSIGVPIAAGWNMISNPLTTTGDSVRQLFPHSLNDHVYTFAGAGGYALSHRMSNTVGYWGKFPGAETNIIAGFARTSDSVSVRAGWNMVGSISVAIDTAGITSVPAGIKASQWFDYSGGYDPSGYIQPGRAYWIKASAAGKFLFSTRSTRPAAAGPAAFAELNSITITDRQGSTQTLYFGADASATILPSDYEMPPPPPAGVLDARFQSATAGLLLQTLAANPGQTEFPIVVQAEAYPLKITWNVKGDASADGNVAAYELTDGAGGSFFQPVVVRGQGELLVTKAGLTKPVLRVSGGVSLPREFALSQNYPNPFNPSTTIQYAIPVGTYGRASLQVYDVLGREVATLVNEVKDPGTYTVRWDATGVASGVYFYRLVSGSFTQTKRMMVVK